MNLKSENELLIEEYLQLRKKNAPREDIRMDAMRAYCMEAAKVCDLSNLLGIDVEAACELVSIINKNKGEQK